MLNWPRSPTTVKYLLVFPDKRATKPFSKAHMSSYMSTEWSHRQHEDIPVWSYLPGGGGNENPAAIVSLSKGNFDEICQNNLLGLATSRSDKNENPAPRETKSGRRCFSVVRWLAFPFTGQTLGHHHHHQTTSRTRGFSIPNYFTQVNLRPPGNWGFPSSTWELRLIAPDLFLFFHELVMLLWQGNKAFWFVKQFIQVTLGGSIWCLRGGIPVDYTRSIGTKMRELCWF